MDAFLQQFQDLKIPLDEIKSATNNFNNENCIGVGGFGKVYKGEVSHSKGRSMVAIKRLDPKYGQGIPEFLKEITTLSRYSHENLISLLGFCYQEDEMILVYEHASRGSLDRHLNSPHLTWSQRLKICLDAAEGLCYLHDPKEAHQRLIHCDVKSANILLDDQWNGKVSDFGLSIMAPANEQQSLIVTMAVGSPGYYDPQYAMTHTLTKESDVYSFGVVLFEVLYGRLCYTHDVNGRVQQILVPTWIENYKQKSLSEVIFKHPTIQPLDESALEIFSDIAYRCLKESREDRPSMAEVQKQLKNALECHEAGDGKLYFYHKQMAETATPPLEYESRLELKNLLFKGVLLNGGKTWFLLNKKREHCVMISVAECLNSDAREFKYKPRKCKSRFALGAYCSENRIFKTHVNPQFLSPGVAYTMNLVFRMEHPEYVRRREVMTLIYKLRIRMKRPEYVRKLKVMTRKYKLQEETKTLISCLADKREDGWWMCELYRFTSDQTVIDLEIQFQGLNGYRDCFFYVEGIEFRPLEEVERSKDEKQPVSDSFNYEKIMKRSKHKLEWTTKKEAYTLCCKGFLIDGGQKWFSLDKYGKECYMISIRAACPFIGDRNMISLSQSRFGKALEFYCILWIRIDTVLKLSSGRGCACYLVYKYPKDSDHKYDSGYKYSPFYDNRYPEYGHSCSSNWCFSFSHPAENMSIYEKPDFWGVNLVTPKSPVRRPTCHSNTSRPVYTLKNVPQQRPDGWMEVQIWKCEYDDDFTGGKFRVSVKMEMSGRRRPIIQGFEFRTI